MTIANVVAPKPPAQPRDLVHTAIGRLLMLLAAIIWPACWLGSSWLHAQQCGFGLASWTCDESFLDAVLHQALVFIGPWAAIVLVAHGDDLRRPR
jgi:hypothetical protein